MIRPDIHAVFDNATNTVTYLVSDPETGVAAVIDPVLDYQAASGRTSTASVDALLSEVEAHGLTLEWVLETHAHADHLSAGDVIRERTGARIGAGSGIKQVQATFADLFAADDVTPDGSVFDCLFEDGDSLSLGALNVEIIHTPGHTPACVCYRIGDDVFVGDTLFMPDFGSARCDFPGGDATTLYRSIQRILALPDETRLHVGHDYPPKDGSRGPAWQTTVGEQKASNIHVGGGRSEADFVAMREARDATLPVPGLLLPALQINIRAGALPPPDASGRRFLKLPLNGF